MKVRMTSIYRILILMIVFAGASARAEQHNQQMMQQQQQQQGMGMGMGMGGGMGGGAQYESKREEITKSLEQPAKEAQKAMTETVNKMGQEISKMVTETSKSIQSSMAKDEKMDEKLVEGLTKIQGADLEARREQNKAFVADIEKLSQTQADALAKQAEHLATGLAAMQASPISSGPPTIGERLGGLAAARDSGNGGLAAATAARNPASAIDVPADTAKKEHGAAATALPGMPTETARAFRRGTVHNLPAGFQLE